MTIITPAGKQNFVWSPKRSGLTKTAGTGTKQLSDKDLLYAAAKKVVKAQFDLEQGNNPEDVEVCAPCGENINVADDGESVTMDGGVEDIGGEAADISDVTDGTEEVVKDVAVKTDAIKAVQELSDKANKAEELAGKVEEAVSKVEEAIQEVKSIVGNGDEDDAGAPKAKGKGKDKGKKDDEVVLEVEVEDDDEEVEIEVEDDDEKDEKEDDEKDEGDKDEIIKESVEACSTAKTEMRTAANDPDDLYKLSKISPATRKKVYTYWKDYLDYGPDYCKLMTTDFEK
jgi:hypothetical protein